MKKFFLVLMTMLIVITTLNADDVFSFGAEEDDNYRQMRQITLYLPNGITLKGTSRAISTENDYAFGTTDIGRFAIYPESEIVFAETEEEFVLYLIYGGFTIETTEEPYKPIALYTPTTKTTFSSVGSFIFETGVNTERFINLSDAPVTSLDYVSESEYTVPAFSQIDYLLRDRISDVSISESETLIPDWNMHKEAESTEEAEVTEETAEETIAESEVTEEDISTEEPEVPLSDESEITAEEATPHAEVVLKSGSVNEDKFSFSIGGRMRSFASNNLGKSLRLSLLLSFSYSRFNFSLNIEPFAILDFANNKTPLDWVSYILNFIGRLSVGTQSQIFSLDIARGIYIDGDTQGLYRGVNPFYLGADYPLEMDMRLNTTYFDMRLFASDLTFARNRFILGEKGEASDESNSILSAEAKFYFSKRYPAWVNVGVLALLFPENLGNSIYYPELSVYFPFLFNNADFGLRFGASTRILTQKPTMNPVDSGYMLSVELPMRFGGFAANLGMFLSYGGTLMPELYPMHYMGIGNAGYKPIADSSIPQLTLLAELGFEGTYAGIRALILGDIALNDMSFIKENSLLDASLYFNIFNTKISTGLRVQNFINLDSYKENAMIYASLEFGSDNFSISALGGVNSIENHDFFLSFEGRANILDTDKGKMDPPIEVKKYRFDIDFGYEYLFEGKENTFSANPQVTIDFLKNSSIALQVPVKIGIAPDGIGLMPLFGRNWLLFATDEEDGVKKIYDTVTDIFFFIGHANFGSRDDSPLYLRLERDYKRNSLMFSNFGSGELLSLSTGFNTSFLSLDVFVDSIEQSHLGEATISIYPFGNKILGLSVGSTAEFYIKDGKNYSLLLHPSLSVGLGIFPNHITLSAYAIGTVRENFENGKNTQNSIFWSKSLNGIDQSIFGLSLNMDWKHFSLHLYSGVQSGGLSLSSYNEFTSIYNLGLSSTEATSKSFYPFARADMTFSFERFKLNLGYSLPKIDKNILKAEDDILSFDMEIGCSDNLTIFMSFKRMGFLSLFSNSFSFDDLIHSCNSIYDIGFTVKAGRISITTLLTSKPYYYGFTEDGGYINMNKSYDTTLGISPTFSIKARISY